MTADTDTLRDIVREHMNGMKSATARRFETEFKVPTCDMYPEIYWIACVAVPPDEPFRNPWGTLVPEDWEVAQIASYIDYKLTTFYREHYADKVRAKALPVCAGHNTVTFVKRPDQVTGNWVSSSVGWGYRRMTWQTGAWPHAYGHAKATNLPDGPLSLVQVIDHCEGFGDKPNPKWDAWKAEHPETFPVA